MSKSPEGERVGAGVFFDAGAAEAALSERWASRAAMADGMAWSSSSSVMASSKASGMASSSGGGSVWGSKSALVLEAGVVDFEAELRAVMRRQYAEDGRAK